MNSGCHGLNIDVAFKIQVIVHFFSLICFYYFYLSIIFRLNFFYILNVYFFVSRYIATYICIRVVANFFVQSVDVNIKKMFKEKIIHKKFETDSSFNRKKRTMGRV